MIRPASRNCSNGESLSMLTTLTSYLRSLYNSSTISSWSRCDHRIAAGSGAGARVQVRGLDHVPEGAPPVWRAGKGERFTSRALRVEEVRAIHGCGTIGEDDAIEDEGDVHGRAVLPVVGELHGDRGESGAEDPLVYGGVITPVIGVEVGEDKSSRRWQFCLG